MPKSGHKDKQWVTETIKEKYPLNGVNYLLSSGTFQTSDPTCQSHGGPAKAPRSSVTETPERALASGSKFGVYHFCPEIANKNHNQSVNVRKERVEGM